MYYAGKFNEDAFTTWLIRGTLYYLHYNNDVEARTHAACIETNNTEEKKLHNLKMWHIRLRHLPFNNIQIIFPKLKGKYINDSCFCTICPLKKQTRSSFSKKIKDTQSVFQLLHMDV